jgi:superfamily II DNA or RNA helicase
MTSKDVMTSERIFFHQYDLSKAHTVGSRESENDEPFQKEALIHFSEWYARHKSHSGNAGEILFLPTGAGKTHVAISFLCTKPLSDGYKVLWLAHTHHLLEQAFSSFEKHLGLITEPRQTLSVRVVSGTKGHFRVHAIRPNDDVIIATLQTITKAYNERHPALEYFLESTN